MLHLGCFQEVVYVTPPQELCGKPREALDAYLRQLPRMHRLLEESHKLVSLMRRVMLCLHQVRHLSELSPNVVLLGIRCT